MGARALSPDRFQPRCIITRAASDGTAHASPAVDREHGAVSMSALDACNRRFRRAAVVLANAGFAPKGEWSTKFELRSPRWTTKLDEIPAVKAACEAGSRDAGILHGVTTQPRYDGGRQFGRPLDGDHMPRTLDHDHRGAGDAVAQFPALVEAAQTVPFRGDD